MRLSTAQRLYLAFLIFIFILFLPPGKAFAQTTLEQGASQTLSDWVPDDEVTLIGKAAVRASQFLDWTLNPENANWVFLAPDTSINQLAAFWSVVRNIAYVISVLIVLFTAFLIIATRGQSINARRQIFVVGGILVLITFSFALIQFIYQLTDTLQGFFLKLPGKAISSQDLLYIGFNYEDTFGLRRKGPMFDESANVSLFLIKATIVTYYAMAGMLLVRKIILWFFIVLSPLWVLLLPFPFIRNAAKIWIGEFFRWLLYGPLFAVLISGLVQMWRLGIPLNFTTSEQPIVYPTSISILIGGPGENVSIANSVNNIDTYAKYIIALLMLWIVILLPFLLLRIFRDVFTVVLKEDNVLLQRILGAIYPFLARAPFVPPRMAPAEGERLARALQYKAEKAPPQVGQKMRTLNIESLPQTKTVDIIKLAGLSVPSIRDLAHMEIDRAALMQNQALLQKISAPTSIANIRERSRFASIQQELLSRARKGDLAATTVISAAETARTGEPASAPLPTVNRIQTIEVEGYGEAKKMWKENYRKTREDWLRDEAAKLELVIELLSNVSDEKKKKGLEQLILLLPFILLGGFSDQEILTYFKARLEAAEEVLFELEQKKGDKS